MYSTLSLLMFCLSYCACQSTRDQSDYRSSFSCVGRSAGYYADIDSGCQLYHLCDSEGRRFTHTCPNATLFQQRMMICDHWYMVDCSRAQHDYSANLLLGQRDKPFVAPDEHIHRHPVKELNEYNGALQHPNWFPSLSELHSATADQSSRSHLSRKARNRNVPRNRYTALQHKEVTPIALPEKYKNNIFLKRLFATTSANVDDPEDVDARTTPQSEVEVSQNVLELRLVDPRYMFFIPEDTAPTSGNGTILFIPLPTSSSHATSGVMQFRKEQETSKEHNPACPICHPGYLLPGKCEPCVIIR